MKRKTSSSNTRDNKFAFNSKLAPCNSSGKDARSCKMLITQKMHTHSINGSSGGEWGREIERALAVGESMSDCQQGDNCSMSPINKCVKMLLQRLNPQLVQDTPQIYSLLSVLDLSENTLHRKLIQSMNRQYLEMEIESACLQRWIEWLLAGVNHTNEDVSVFLSGALSQILICHTLPQVYAALHDSLNGVVQDIVLPALCNRNKNKNQHSYHQHELLLNSFKLSFMYGDDIQGEEHHSQRSAVMVKYVTKTGLANPFLPELVAISTGSRDFLEDVLALIDESFEEKNFHLYTRSQLRILTMIVAGMTDHRQAYDGLVEKWVRLFYSVREDVYQQIQIWLSSRSICFTQTSAMSLISKLSPHPNRYVRLLRTLSASLSSPLLLQHLLAIKSMVSSKLCCAQFGKVIGKPLSYYQEKWMHITLYLAYRADLIHYQVASSQEVQLIDGRVVHNINRCFWKGERVLLEGEAEEGDSECCRRVIYDYWFQIVVGVGCHQIQLWGEGEVGIKTNLEDYCHRILRKHILEGESIPESIHNLLASHLHSLLQPPLNAHQQIYYTLHYILVFRSHSLPFQTWHGVMQKKRENAHNLLYPAMLLSLQHLTQDTSYIPSPYLEQMCSGRRDNGEFWRLYAVTLASFVKGEQNDGNLILEGLQSGVKNWERVQSMLQAQNNGVEEHLKIEILLSNLLIQILLFQASTFLSCPDNPAQVKEQISSAIANMQAKKPVSSAKENNKTAPNRLQLEIYSLIAKRDYRIEITPQHSIKAVNGELRQIRRIKKQHNNY